jgi:hypothetical protein
MRFVKNGCTEHIFLSLLIKEVKICPGTTPWRRRLKSLKMTHMSSSRRIRPNRQLNLQRATIGEPP